jgi:hypothetical protein
MDGANRAARKTVVLHPPSPHEPYGHRSQTRVAAEGQGCRYGAPRENSQRRNLVGRPSKTRSVMYVAEVVSAIFTILLSQWRNRRDSLWRPWKVVVTSLDATLR